MCPFSVGFFFCNVVFSVLSRVSIILLWMKALVALLFCVYVLPVGVCVLCLLLEVSWVCDLQLWHSLVILTCV